MKCKLILAAAVVAMACSAAFAAGRTMLAVPARHDMVGFGFDLLRLLPDNLELACYKGEDSIERLEVFDRTAWEWRTITTENWAAGLWRANSLVIAGENKAASDLLALSGWTQQTKMPSDRAKLDVVNAVNAFQPLNEKQWKSLAATYGFKFTKVERPSSRERRRDEARARREAARARREEARQQREVEKTIERQRKQMKRQEVAPRPQTEVIPAPAPVVAPVVVKPAPAPVEIKPAPAPVEIKRAPVVPPAGEDKTLAAPFEGSSAITDMPPALDDAAKLKAASQPKVAVPEVKKPEAKAPEAPDIVFKKRVPAAEAKVPEVKTPEVKTLEAKPVEAKPTDAETKVKAAVEAAVSEAAAKTPKVEAAPASAPAAVEVRVPAREAVAPKVETPVVPAKTPEAAPAKVPETKPVEVTVPEVKVPAAKPVEVAAPDVKVPEVKPVQTPEIKVPAIVLDPM